MNLLLIQSWNGGDGRSPSLDVSMTAYTASVIDYVDVYDETIISQPKWLPMIGVGVVMEPSGWDGLESQSHSTSVGGL